MMNDNSTRFPVRLETWAKAAAESVEAPAMIALMNKATPPTQSNTTGSRMGSFCIQATDNRPAKVEADVASRMGKNTIVGSAAPC